MSILEWIKQLPSGGLGMVAGVFIYLTLKFNWACHVLICQV